MSSLELFRKTKSKRAHFCYPSIKNPRVIVPLSSKKTFLSGLKIHNVAASKNILIKSFIEKLYYIWKYVKINRLYSAQDLDLLLNDLQKRLNITCEIYCSFYKGTAGSSNQKYTLQIMDENAYVIGIIKFPITDQSNSFIKNEYDTLKSLNKEKYQYIEIPNQLEYFNYASAALLFENNVFKNTRILKFSLDDFIVNASIELAKKNLKNTNAEYCNRLESDPNVNKFPTDLKLTFLDLVKELKVQQIPTVLIHGDFVLYNMRRKEDKLVLVDWEFSRYGLPLFDLLHFTFQGLFLIKKISLEKIIKQIYDDIFIREYLTKFGISNNLLFVLLKAYLFDYLIYDYKVKRIMDLRASQYYKGLLILEKLLK